MDEAYGIIRDASFKLDLLYANYQNSSDNSIESVITDITEAIQSLETAK